MNKDKEQKVLKIKLTDINVSPENVRNYKNIDSESIEELARSIKLYGQLQPILLIQGSPKHELIVGQRRFYAMKSIGEKYIKAVFTDRKYDKVGRIIVSLAENMQRSQLTYDDIANAINKIYDHFKDVKRVAKEIGVSLPTVYNYLMIEKYATPKIKKMLNKKEVSREDVKRAIYITRGKKDEVEGVLSKLKSLSNYDKVRAVEIAKENPLKPTSKIFEEANKPKITDILILNLMKDVLEALNKAEKELFLSKEDIASNAIRAWLKENRFLK